MSRIAEYLEHPGEMMSHATHALAHRPKSSLFGIILIALGVIGVLAMWPEIQRYLKMRRM